MAIKKNVLFNILKTISSMFYPIITFIYVTRILTVENMGMINFSKNITSYFILIAALGVNYYGIREASRIKHKKEKLSIFFWEIFTINMMSSLIAFFIMIFCIFNIKSLETYRILLFINLCSVILGGMNCEWLINATEEFKFIALCSFLIQLICIVLMVFYIHKSSDYLIYAGLLVFTGYGNTLFNYIFIIRKKYIKWINPKKWRIKKHLKPILILFAMYVSIEFYTVLDTVMLGFIQGNRSIGIYSAAIKIPRIVNSLIAAIGIVMVPKLSYFYEYNQKEFFDLLEKSMKIVFILIFPCMIGIFFLADGIIILLCGEQYIEAIKTVRILSFLIIFIPVSVLFNNQIFIPIRKEIYVLQGTVMGAIVNIILNFLLIPKYGENGAAIASVVAEFFVLCVCIFNVKKELKRINVLNCYLKYFKKAILVLAIVLICKFLITNTILCLFISIFISVVVYIFIYKKEIKLIIEGLDK